MIQLWEGDATPDTSNKHSLLLLKYLLLSSGNMSTKEEIETKLGHPPAMKVGGVRIAQRRRSFDEKEESPKPQKNGEEETAGEEKEEEQTEEKPVTKRFGQNFIE
ncbi:unnamed protein product [Meganyctiphanes norvegica]|uniref:Uncharacterized protein n=1 Tax=Meganyctiphanes norvegica TaxID=48144 RepID=A0AAV2RTQ7_MEGNR